MEFAEVFALRPYTLPKYQEQVDYDFGGPAHDVYALYIPEVAGETYTLFSPVDGSMRRIMHTFMQIAIMIQTAAKVPRMHDILVGRQARLDSFASLLTSESTTAAADGAAEPEESGEFEARFFDMVAAVDSDDDDSDDEDAPQPARTAAADSAAADSAAAHTDDEDDEKKYRIHMLGPYLDSVGDVVLNLDPTAQRAMDISVYLLRVRATSSSGKKASLGHVLVAFTHGIDRVPLALPAMALFSSEILFHSSKDKRIVLSTLLMPFNGAPNTDTCTLGKFAAATMDKSLWGRARPKSVLNNLRTDVLLEDFLSLFPETDEHMTDGWGIFGNSRGLFSKDTAMCCLQHALNTLDSTETWSIDPAILTLLGDDTPGPNARFTIPHTMLLQDCALINPVPRDFDLLLTIPSSMYIHRHLYTATPMAAILKSHGSVGDYITAVKAVLPLHARAVRPAIRQRGAAATGASSQEERNLRYAATLATLKKRRSITVTYVHPNKMDSGVPTYDGLESIPRDKVLLAGKGYTSHPTPKAPTGGRYPTSIVQLLSGRFFSEHTSSVITDTLSEMSRRISMAKINQTLFSPAHTEILKAADVLVQHTLPTQNMLLRFPSTAPSTPLFDFSRAMFIFEGTVHFVNATNRWATQMVLLGSFFPRGRLHCMIEGDPGSGKSVSVEKGTSMLLPETAYTVTSQSLASMMNAGEPYIVSHGALNIYDEMCGMLGPANKQRQTSDAKLNEIASIMKVFMHQGSASRSLANISKETGRSVEMFDVRGDFNLMGLTNMEFLSEFYIDLGLLDRCAVIFVKATDRIMGPATQLGTVPDSDDHIAMHTCIKRVRTQSSTGSDWRRMESEQEMRTTGGGLNVRDFQNPNCNAAGVKSMIQSVQMLARVADEILEILEERAVHDKRVMLLLPNTEVYQAVEKTLHEALKRQGITNPSNRKCSMASSLARSLSVLNEIMWCFYANEAGVPITLPHIMFLISRAVVSEDIAMFALAQVLSADITRERVVCMAVTRYVCRMHKRPGDIYKSTVETDEGMGAPPAPFYVGNTGAGSDSENFQNVSLESLRATCITEEQRLKKSKDRITKMKAVLQQKTAELNRQAILATAFDETTARDPATGLRLDHPDLVSEFDWTRILFSCPRNDSVYHYTANTLAGEISSLNLGFELSKNEVLYQLRVMQLINALRFKVSAKALLPGHPVKLTATDFVRAQADHSMGKLVEKADLRDNVQRSSLAINCIVSHNGAFFLEDVMKMKRGGRYPGWRVGLGFFSFFNAKYMSHRLASRRMVVFNEQGELGHKGHIPAHTVITPGPVDTPPALKTLYDKYHVTDPGTPLETAILKHKAAMLTQTFGTEHTSLPFVMEAKYRAVSSLGIYNHRKWTTRRAGVPETHAAGSAAGSEYTLQRLVDEFDLPSDL